MRIAFTLLLTAWLLTAWSIQAQTASENQPPPPAPSAPQDYVCPMDKDVRSDKPGTCPRCGMKLVLGIPDDVEYPLDLQIKPAAFRAGEKVQFTFRITDPKTSKTVNHFEIVHEKFFHMFIASQDLQFFMHEHPVPQADGTFQFDMTFPKPGMYRVVGDFYPTGGTPQLVARTVIVPGAPGVEIPFIDAKLKPELGVSHCANMDVELVMDPPQPIAGMKTLLFFKVNPGDGLEQYLSAWGHMLVASDDLIDLIHDHPFIADGGPQMQFNIIFPRARMYRIWVQFQRKGVVNTASFTVPVAELK
ncbi:MAG TPA: heavy metal-binding domain-containing protein [Bryobacteraceae bacterium]|nr:heavy metal-binding domain-containing protein [Bryobacteraceae bacterium]